jgi:cobalt-zinc-cadmium efflux system outer membrane protein
MGFYARWSLFWGLLAIMPSAYAQGQSLSITFEELADYAVKHSPSVRIIEENYKQTQTERDLEMQWSNPDIDYLQEYAGEEREHFLTLSKEIEMPWVYAPRRSAWKARLGAAKFEREARLREYFQEIKTNYVELELLNRQAIKLLEAKQIIERMASVAKQRLQEGALSGLEQQTIQMALFNMKSVLVDINQKRLGVESEFKVKLGIDESELIRLGTEIRFNPAALDTEGISQDLVLQMPGYLTRQERIAAAESRIRMERGRVIPSVDLIGGYKNVTSLGDGYVLGISVPLPVLNQNRPQVEREKLRLRIMKEDLHRYSLQKTQLIRITLDVVKSYWESLGPMALQIHGGEAFLEAASVAFGEGQLSLADSLNAIQIHLQGIREYYQQLTAYYSGLFLLESISGVELVSFSPTGENR